MPHDLMPTDPPVTDEQAAKSFVSEMPRLTGRIAVLDYDERWPLFYKQHATRLRTVLGSDILALEHVGSTAVPGLAAKPVIDIDLSVADSADEAAYAPRLEAAGYRLMLREPHWLEHRMFKGPPSQEDGADINLHIWTLGSPEAQRHIILRDWLRMHESDRLAYGAHKKRLAQQPYAYMHEYNNDKAEVIREILGRALAAQPEPRT